MADETTNDIVPTWEPDPWRWHPPTNEPRRCPDGAVCSVCPGDQPCRRILRGVAPSYGDRWKPEHVEREVARARRTERVSVSLDVVLWVDVDIPPLSDARDLEDLLNQVGRDRLIEVVRAHLDDLTRPGRALGHLQLHSVDADEPKWDAGPPVPNPPKADVPGELDRMTLPGLPGRWATDGTMLVRCDALDAGLVLRDPSYRWIASDNPGEVASYVIGLIDPLASTFAGWNEAQALNLREAVRARARHLLYHPGVKLVTTRSWVGVFDAEQLTVSPSDIGNDREALCRALVALVGRQS